MAQQKKPKVLIFVIAYYAESTLKSVLERIPAKVYEDYSCEILVVDDGSEDKTFAIGREFKDAHPEIKVTVLRNEFNQGYGGNQKIGYSYALTEGFDFVAMVHGDGQYAPEELPKLLQPLREGDADAVFGSRMMERFAALKGGMPLYKYVGNKVLTVTQNAMLGTHLSEFHSGYRIYATSALRQIPFQLNSNDFHFDTEIIIQLFNAKMRIKELPIPTYYGNEICRVNGIKYAKDVLIATLRNSAHRSGILHMRKFEPLTEANHHYDLKLGYAHTGVHGPVPPVDEASGDADALYAVMGWQPTPRHRGELRLGATGLSDSTGGERTTGIGGLSYSFPMAGWTGRAVFARDPFLYSPLILDNAIDVTSLTFGASGALGGTLVTGGGAGVLPKRSSRSRIGAQGPSP